MVSLWAKDDQTVGELGEALVLESSTLTPLLKRLEAAGNLTRTRDPSDERQGRVPLSSAGRAPKKKSPDIPGSIIEATGPLVAALGRIPRGNRGPPSKLLK